MFSRQLVSLHWKAHFLLFFASFIITALTFLPGRASTFDAFTALNQSPATPVLVAPLLASDKLATSPATLTTSTPITGTFGSSDWSLQDGTLTIGAGDFANHTGNTSPWATYSNQITKIVITGPVTFNTSAVALFAGLGNLTQIDGLEKVDTSQTTNLNDLFSTDSQLTDLTGIEHWETSKVRSIDRTFFATALVGTLDLSHWDVSSLTSGSMAFARAGALDENSNRLFTLLNLSGWNFQAPKVNLATFGYQLQALAIDTSNWQNTTHITSMESMFTFSAIKKIDLSSFDMRHLPPSSGTRQMFTYAWQLKELKLGPNSKLAGTGLPTTSETNKYTGMWQNIGTGTVNQPNGERVLTREQLLAAYDGTNTPATDTFVWQVKPAQPVTVHYVDRANPTEPIKPATTITGTIEDDFTITPPRIDGYTYQGTQDDVPLTGVISGDAQAVTLLYTKQARVTVNYQAEDGKTIAPATTLSGDVGTSYTVEPQTIAGYNYFSGNLTGTFTEADQTVTLTYRAIPTEGHVTVNYLDADGNVLAAPETMTGKLGSTYTIVPRKIDGYHYQSGELTGTYTTTSQAVNLIYQKDVVNGTVTVHYTDEQGNQLADATTLSGPVDSDYTIDKKTIPGYYFLNGHLTGKFTTEAQTVTLTYRKDAVAQGTVTVNYVDEQGKTLAPATKLTGDVETPYVISQPTIDKYVYHHADGPLSGHFTKAPQTVTLVYHSTETQQGQVIVKYQDDTGHTLAPDTKLSGSIGTTYTITPPTFDHYRYDSANGELTGKFSSTTPTVILTYAKQPVTTQGQVIVNYLDLDGQVLAPATTLTGALDTPYTTTVQAIADYQHVKTTGHPTGVFKSQVQTISYFYQKTAAENDQRQLTGQDFTMTVGDPTPTAADFKATAKDKHGQPITVKVDLGQAKLDQAGTYPVTLRTNDGQTLQVHLIVKAMAQLEPGKPDQILPPTTKPTEESKPELQQPMGPQKPKTPSVPQAVVADSLSKAPSNSETKTTRKLPATGERRTHLLAAFGLLSCIGLIVAFLKRSH